MMEYIHHHARVEKEDSTTSETWVSALLIILVALIGVLPHLFREFLMGTDPYFYLLHAGVPVEGFPPIFFFLMNAPPQLLLFGMSLLIVSVYYLIVKDSGCSTNAMLLLLAAPAFTFRLGLLEDDLLGVALGMLMLYFYMKNHCHENHKYWYAGIAVFCIGLLSWRGIFIFLGPIAMHLLWTKTKSRWIAFIPLLLIPLFIKPDLIVGEQALGLIYLPIVLLGVLMGLANTKRANSLPWFWAWWFVACGVMQAKWVWLALFPCALLLADWLNTQNKEKVKSFLVFAIGLGLVMGFLMVASTPPTSSDMDMVKDVVGITGSDPICSEWWLGHWIAWQGGNPIHTPLSPTLNRYEPCDAKWHLTVWSLPLEEYRSYGNFTLYRVHE